MLIGLVLFLKSDFRVLVIVLLLDLEIENILSDLVFCVWFGWLIFCRILVISFCCCWLVIINSVCDVLLKLILVVWFVGSVCWRSVDVFFVFRWFNLYIIRFMLRLVIWFNCLISCWINWCFFFLVVIIKFCVGLLVMIDVCGMVEVIVLWIVVGFVCFNV